MSKVQCFYNVNYNEGVSDGKSKFAWGFGVFDLSEKKGQLREQIIDHAEIREHGVFNLNLISFTPFHDAVFDRVDENE